MAPRVVSSVNSGLESASDRLLEMAFLAAVVALTMVMQSFVDSDELVDKSLLGPPGVRIW